MAGELPASIEIVALHETIGRYPLALWNEFLDAVTHRIDAAVKRLKSGELQTCETPESSSGSARSGLPFGHHFARRLGRTVLEQRSCPRRIDAAAICRMAESPSADFFRCHPSCAQVPTSSHGDRYHRNRRMPAQNRRNPFRRRPAPPMRFNRHSLQKRSPEPILFPRVSMPARMPTKCWERSAKSSARRKRRQSDRTATTPKTTSTKLSTT